MTNDTKLIVMPFGKYCGTPIGEIPSSYLEWIATGIRENWHNFRIAVKAASDEWEFREKNNCHFEE